MVAVGQLQVLSGETTVIIYLGMSLLIILCIFIIFVLMFDLKGWLELAFNPHRKYYKEKLIYLYLD